MECNALQKSHLLIATIEAKVALPSEHLGWTCWVRRGNWIKGFHKCTIFLKLYLTWIFFDTGSNTCWCTQKIAEVHQIVRHSVMSRALLVLVIVKLTIPFLFQGYHDNTFWTINLLWGPLQWGSRHVFFWQWTAFHHEMDRWRRWVVKSGLLCKCSI